MPLTNLLNCKGKLADWGPDQDVAFAQACKPKSALASVPVLKVADPRRPFLLNCDASNHAVGGVLLHLVCLPGSLVRQGLPTRWMEVLQSYDIDIYLFV